MIEPTSEPNKVLDKTALIPIVNLYRDGMDRSTKQEWLAVGIQIIQKPSGQRLSRLGL